MYGDGPARGCARILPEHHIDGGLAGGEIGAISARFLAMQFQGKRGSVVMHEVIAAPQLAPLGHLRRIQEYADRPPPVLLPGMVDLLARNNHADRNRYRQAHPKWPSSFMSLQNKVYTNFCLY